MLIKFISYIFGDKNKRKILNLQKIINKINSLEYKFMCYKNEELKFNTYKFRDLLLSGSKLSNLLPYIFSNIREAIKRVFGIRLFDVQLIGALVLNDGCIAEMKTGEGKTITATLPAYLNSLFNNGVHIVTVNDYLAKRDSCYSSKLFNFLGLTVGLNLSTMSVLEKKNAYLSDVTYGTSSEFGFDYLRDNMVLSLEDRVQRKELNYAILDEIDSILIDEARTPLVISGSTEENISCYYKVNKIIPYLLRQDKDDSDEYNGKGDFVVDEKSRNVFLTERGIIKVESLLVKENIFLSNKNNFYNSSNNITIMNCVISSLKAYYLYIKNVDYLVKENNVIIVDEHTGRMMPDRRWSDGLHQAIEAKENVEIKNENKTLASITFQNYFKLYNKLSGMTGTAVTESLEFSTIYNMDTFSIPTNKPMIRKDWSDLVYLTEKEKNESIIKDIKYRNQLGQPILVGTISINKSELFSSLLDKIGIKHNVLNAKFHKLEANIIAQAGKLGAITIATNMAGRGTDIILGGSFSNNNIDFKNNQKLYREINFIKKKWQKDHDLVVSLGGLHIIGTERHESRRIDNQLRGRSGRQGDPGSSRFYISMEDYLMRIFVSKKIIFFMRKLGIKYGESIEHNWINKSIEKAQKKIESRNFDLRKQLLDYDDVYNDQRKIIYSIRNKILYSSNIDSKIFKITKIVVNNLIFILDFNKNLFLKYCTELNINMNFLKINSNLFLIKRKILREIFYLYKKKTSFLGCESLNKIKKNIVLQVLDSFWKEYLNVINYFKESIYLRSYAQRNPKQEYKVESFKIFTKMLNNFYYEVIRIIINLSSPK